MTLSVRDKHIARKLGQAGGDPVIEGVKRVVDEIL